MNYIDTQHVNTFYHTRWQYTLVFKSILILSLTSIILGCTTENYTHEEKTQPLVQKSPVELQNYTPSYLKVENAQPSDNAATVSYLGTIALGDAVRRFLPDGHIMPMDSGVDLAKSLQIVANRMPMNDFINYLSRISGYEIKTLNNGIEIRSFVTNEWNLATLSGSKKVNLKSNAAMASDLDETKTASTLEETLEYDEWQQLLLSARRIIGVETSSQSTSQQKSYVFGTRSLGKVVAAGNYQSMQQLDEYFTQLQYESSRQVAIEVKAYDVMLSDGRGSGINWSELATVGASVNGNPLSLNLQNTNAGGGFIPNALDPAGLWQGRAAISGSKVNASAVFQFLSQFGEVELLNQPNITVRNGGFAVMHAGEQLSYVAKTEVVRESGEDTVAVSAQVDQLKVGVSLAVTPKLLDGNKVLLNIWPVVSSVQGFDEFNSDPVPIRVPRLALQELATEVIVPSGQTIQLGGLIRRNITEKLQTLPWRDGVTGALLKAFFHSDSKSLERRELVILVTPKVLD